MKKQIYTYILIISVLFCWNQHSYAQWQKFGSPKGTKIKSISNYNTEPIISADSGVYTFNKTLRKMNDFLIKDVDFNGANCFFQKDINVLFVGTLSSGIIRSTDAGNTWYFTNNNMPGKMIYSFSNINGTIYACTDNGIFESSNQGTNWTKKNFSSDKYYYSIVKMNSQILIATSNGLYKSKDTLKTMQTANVNGNILSMIEKKGCLTVLSASNGIYYSTDTAKTWKLANGTLPYKQRVGGSNPSAPTTVKTRVSAN